MTSASDRPIAAGPWPAEQILRAIVGNGAGLLLIAVGSFECAISAEADLRTRLAWLALSIAGLAVAGISNALLILRGHTMLGISRRGVIDEVRTLVPGGVETNGARSVSLVAGTGMTRYHVDDCVLVNGKNVRIRTRAALARAGLEPCEVCRP